MIDRQDPYNNKAPGRAIVTRLVDGILDGTYNTIEDAQIAFGRYEEGLSKGLEALRESPGSAANYALAICCLVNLGRTHEARDLVGELLRVSPNFTITEFVRTAVSQGEEWRTRYAEAFRIAGLAE